MSVPVPAAAIVRYEPALSEAELTTLAGFLAATGATPVTPYALDLRQFTAWCLQRGRHLFDVRRVDIECFARDLEAPARRGRLSPAGCARSSVSTVTPKKKASIERSPAVHVRRPRARL